MTDIGSAESYRWGVESIRSERKHRLRERTYASASNGMEMIPKLSGIELEVQIQQACRMCQILLISGVIPEQSDYRSVPQSARAPESALKRRRSCPNRSQLTCRALGKKKRVTPGGSYGRHTAKSSDAVLPARGVGRVRLMSDTINIPRIG